jgi:hypothetical protein
MSRVQRGIPIGFGAQGIGIPRRARAGPLEAVAWLPAGGRGAAAVWRGAAAPSRLQQVQGVSSWSAIRIVPPVRWLARAQLAREWLGARVDVRWNDEVMVNDGQRCSHGQGAPAARRRRPGLLRGPHQLNSVAGGGWCPPSGQLPAHENCTGQAAPREPLPAAQVWQRWPVLPGMQLRAGSTKQPSCT